MYTSTQLDEILGRVAKPARYVGGEYNVCVKDPAAVSMRAAIVFPDVYEVGMSSLGIQILYHSLNARDDTYCERAFAPWPDMENELRAASHPLYTLETYTPLKDMDLVGFSLGSEKTYTNVLTCLDLGQIPIRSADRDDTHPIVIAGGHTAFNPETMSAFIDAFAVGEGEEVVHEVVDCLISTKGQARSERLRALAEIEGMYVPSLLEWTLDADGNPTGWTYAGEPGRTVRRRVVSDFAALAGPVRPVVPSLEAIHDRVCIEVMRGCTRGCRFCQAGVVTRPVRERSAEQVVGMAEGLLSATGYDDVSLMSLSTLDWTGVEDAVKDLTEGQGASGVGVSLPSLRVDAFSVSLLARIQSVRKSGLTFAPEAGTERLRKAINKDIADSEILGAVEAAWREGWRRIKLYFMIGLPTETDEDILGIAALVRAIQQQAREKGKIKLAITVSASTFVPKPHTPFQWREQPDPVEMARRIELLRGAIRMPGVKLSWDDPREAQLEGMLSRGDRRVGEAIHQAWANGARFDGWSEWLNWPAWDKALEDTGVSAARYANRRRDYGEILPWDPIETGVSKKYLMVEDQRSEEGVVTDDCRKGACRGCGLLTYLSDDARQGTSCHD